MELKHCPTNAEIPEHDELWSIYLNSFELVQQRFSAVHKKQGDEITKMLQKFLNA